MADGTPATTLQLIGAGCFGTILGRDVIQPVAGSGLNQPVDNMRVSEDYGEDQRRPAAACGFIYVSAVGE